MFDPILKKKKSINEQFIIFFFKVIHAFLTQFFFELLFKIFI